MLPTMAKDLRYTGVRALVLGASGFIGSWVARSLGAVGADCHLAVRNKAKAESILAQFGIQGTIHEFDAMQIGALPTLLSEIRPAITFNLIGYGVDPTEREAEKAHRLNSDLVTELGRATESIANPDWKGQCIVHVGSALEYGAAGGDLDEESEPRPDTLYGRTKLAGTIGLIRWARELRLPALTARLFTVYGPGEHAGRLLPSLLELSKTGGSLALTSGLQRRDFTYVGDVADGLLKLGLTETAPGTVVNLATGRLTSVRSFAEIAADVLYIPAEALQFGVKPVRREEMEHSEVNIRRLLSLTDWSPSTEISDGVRATAAFTGGLDIQDG